MKLSHIALSLLMLAPVSAFAQEAGYSVAVSYSDLNLHSEAGLKVLDQRLARAIRTVCAEHDGSAVPEHRFAAQHCVAQKRVEVAGLRDRAIASYVTREAALASH